MKIKLVLLLLLMGIITRAGAACSSCGSVGASTQSHATGPFFSISMGSAQYGQSAGDLTFSGVVPDASLFLPVSLQYDATSRPDVAVITTNLITTSALTSIDTEPQFTTNIFYTTNSMGGGSAIIVTNMFYGMNVVSVTNTTSVYVTNAVIRQIYAPQALADIPPPPTTNGYLINFYYPASVVGTNLDGTYQVSGAPFATWMVTNRNPATMDQLQVSETTPVDGLLKQWNYSYVASTGTWVLQTLAGVQENVTVTNLSVDTSLVINTLQYSNGPVAQQTKTTYQVFTWGTAPIQMDVGSSNAPETTTYTYYDPSTFNAGTLALKQTVVHPDGSQEYYAGYTTNGYPTAVYSSFADDPSGRYTTYDYDPAAAGVSASGDDGTIHSDVPRRVMEYVPGSPGSCRYTVFPSIGVRLDIQCPIPSATWNDSRNLVTTNYFYTSGTNQFRLQSVINADGTMTTYDYGDNGMYWTNISASGQPDSSYHYIVDGVSNRTVVNQWGSMVASTAWDVKTGSVLMQDSYGSYDSYGRPQRVVHLDGTAETNVYACCGLNYSTDRDGVTTVYLYDGDKRQVGYEKLYNTDVVTFNNVLSAAGRVTQSSRTGTDSSVVTLGRSAYDLAGELIAQTNALNGVTNYRRTNDVATGGLIRTITNPDGGVVTNIYYADGSLKQTAGSGVHPVRYLYGAGYDDNGNAATYTAEIKLNNDGTDSSEWTKTYLDFAGRTTEVLYADYHYSQSFYNARGQLSKQIDPDGVTTLYQYNAKGELAYSAVDLNQNGSIDFSGTDRIQWTTNDVTTDHGMTVRRSRTYAWSQNGVNSSALLSVAETSADGLNSWQVNYGDANTAVTNQSQAIYSGASRTVTSIAPDGSYTINGYSYGRLTSSTRYDSTGAPIGGTTDNYDAHERQHQTTDARNGTTTYGYNNADQVNSVTTPNPGGGGSPETTTTLYDALLRPYNVTQPDGTTVSTVYLLTGELGLQSGSRTYPVAYSYDYAGRMKTMTNWSGFSGNTGARVTTWNYDANRGFLTSKAYADGNGPAYTYTSAGRLATRSWVRGITTAYAYDAAGSLTNASYSDSTPAAGYSYDRLGRQQTAVWSGITDTMAYNLANELLTESFSGGTLNGLSVTNGYDRFLRRTNLTALASSVLSRTTYGYDNASRLATASDGTDNASYSYLANSPLVGQIAFKQGSTTRMTTTKQYDYLNRLTSISSVASNTVAFNYNYNAANQRTKNTLVDGSYWVYQYDVLGQVTSGVKYFADGTPVAGQQFGYGFDDIGNRKQTTAGGDQAGANLRLANYTNNLLNQITSRDVPGYVDVNGISLATNIVTVNSQATYRKGEYFRQELPVNNGSLALWTNIIVAATGQTSATGNVYVAKAPEIFRYDQDGNLTNDGRWSYVWDAENRLIQMTVNTNVGPQYQLTFAYDTKGRRIQKVVATNSVAISTNKFLYDGWNLVAEVGSSGTLVRSYVWGSDLSGSMQGAGGVGGLLEVSYYGASTNNCFPAFDGNGNVMALVNAADGTSVANYAYGPFGELVQKTGSLANNNPFRFSTKYQDDESDLLYYGYRYYKPSTGTWPSRDPIGELGFDVSTTGEQPFINPRSDKYLKRLNWLLNQPGANVYGFVVNDPLDKCDVDGRDTWVPYPYPGHYVSDPQPPPPPPSQYPDGFAMCRRNLKVDGPFDIIDKGANCCGGEHTYMQYTSRPQPPAQGPPTIWGWGFSGGTTATQEGAFKPDTCTSCKKNGSSLKYGSGAGTSSTSATDQQIMDCIKNRKPDRRYSYPGYVCSDWAKEAASDCGLTCK